MSDRIDELVALARQLRPLEPVRVAWPSGDGLTLARIDRAIEEADSSPYPPPRLFFGRLDLERAIVWARDGEMLLTLPAWLSDRWDRFRRRMRV